MKSQDSIKLQDSAINPKSCAKGVHIITPCNVYGCELGENVFVGPFCEIQSEVKIGARTRVQSHSFICSLVEIGEECFIGHGVMFVNDLFKEGAPTKDKAQWQSTKIGNNVSIGSNATILPVNICDNVVIGAGSVVSKDITKSGFYAGNPARLLRKL
ncbi:acyltransferase [Helicobacter himalayensis]|uniref:acyltransferase n=1 Tax=Helicobacter himalayensis TaxID=1591088 RepID=UPI003D6FEA2F